MTLAFFQNVGNPLFGATLDPKLKRGSGDVKPFFVNKEELSQAVRSTVHSSGFRVWDLGYHI